MKIEKIELDKIDRQEPINDSQGMTHGYKDNFPIEVVSKINEIIDILNDMNNPRIYGDKI